MAEIKITLDEVNLKNNPKQGLFISVEGDDVQIFTMLSYVVSDFLKRKKPLLRRLIFKLLFDYIKDNSNLSEKPTESLDEIIPVVAFEAAVERYRRELNIILEDGEEGGE